MVLTANVSDLADGVHCIRRGRAHRGADKAGNEAGTLVGFNLAGQSVGAHRELLVDFDQAQIRAADARDHCRLLQRGMRLRGSVSYDVPVTALLVASVVGGALARGQQGAQRRARSSVLNDSAASI